MKKLILMMLLLSIVGCGKYIVKTTFPHHVDINISARSEVNYFIPVTVEVLKNTLDSLIVNSVAYKIIENIGGTGTLGIAYANVGDDCSLIPALETISITTGVVDTAYTLLSPTTVAEINNHINGTYLVCIEVNQDINDPMDVMMKIEMYISAVMSN